jgi:alpha-beta hydrolase superfamily lysophospholipase
MQTVGAFIRFIPRMAARIAAAALMLGAATAWAGPTLDLVRFPAADDRLLLDALYWAPDKPSKSLVLLIPGLTGAVMGGGLHDYRPLANELNAKGYAFLIPQLRSLNNWPYALFDDVVKDIGGAVAFAKLRGYEDIALFGTSLGGPRIAMFMAQKGDPAIRAVGFIASIKSPYLEFQIRQSESERARLDAFLQKARELVAQGRGGEPVAFENWFPNRHMAMTAKSFISFFGREDESNAVSIKFTGAISVPALVIHGTADEIALKPNAEAIHASLTAAPRRDLVWIEGAKHYLTPGWIAEAYAKRIADWVAATMPARPGNE